MLLVNMHYFWRPPGHLNHPWISVFLKRETVITSYQYSKTVRKDDGDHSYSCSVETTPRMRVLSTHESNTSVAEELWSN